MMGKMNWKESVGRAERMEFMKRKSMALLALLLTACMSACSTKTADFSQGKPEGEPTPSIAETQEQGVQEQEAENNMRETESEVITIKVTSESLTPDGKWLTVINSTHANPAGSNLSPQLSWDEVEGAACYAIYMVDNSAGYWLHWRAKNVKETSLPLGADLEESSYIGPYPPSGTHEYEVIVYALKTAPEKYPGTFDSSLTPLSTIEQKLDTVGGVPGNIIGKGSITGTVNVGEIVE